MKRIFEFKVPGVAVGKGRPKFARRGKFVQAYTPAKTASYENLVKMAASCVMTGDLIKGSVKLTALIHCAIPESWSKKKKLAANNGEIRPAVKPDIDNVIKGISDALNGIVFKDDSQICEVIGKKWYAENPCVVVIVEEF